MTDDEDTPGNRCGDLVSLARFEPALLHLFGSKSAGEWVRVGDLYRVAGQPAGDVKDELVAAWLPSPDGDPGGAVILFLDGGSLWSTTAWYDAARLRERHPETPAVAAG